MIADEPDKHGFENIAGLLSVSPSRLERYLAAARKVGLAVGDPTINPTVETYTIPAGLATQRSSQRGSSVRHAGRNFDRSFFSNRRRVPASRFSCNVRCICKSWGMGEAHELDVRIDGVRVKRFSVGGEGKGMTAPESYAGNTQGDPAWEEYMHTADAHLEVRVPVRAGVRKVGVAFVRQYIGSAKASTVRVRPVTPSSRTRIRARRSKAC